MARRTWSARRARSESFRRASRRGLPHRRRLDESPLGHRDGKSRDSDLGRHRQNSRQRRAGEAGGPFEPPRRVGVRRRGSLERDRDAARDGACPGRTAQARFSAAPDHRARKLGRRRVHAHGLDRMGRAVRAGTYQERGRLPQRGRGDQRAGLQPQRHPPARPRRSPGGGGCARPRHRTQRV